MLVGCSWGETKEKMVIKRKNEGEWGEKGNSTIPPFSLPCLLFFSFLAFSFLLFSLLNFSFLFFSFLFSVFCCYCILHSRAFLRMEDNLFYTRTREKREVVRVKCLAKKHETMQHGFTRVQTALGREFLRFFTSNAPSIDTQLVNDICFRYCFCSWWCFSGLKEQNVEQPRLTWVETFQSFITQLSTRWQNTNTVML